MLTINNLFTSLAGIGEMLSLNMLIVILITFVPVIFAIFMGKRYNVFHGIVTYIFVSYLFAFLSTEFNVFQYLLPATGSELIMYISMLELVITYPYLLVAGGIDKIPGSEVIMEGEYASYIVLTAVALIFIISQVIASSIKAKKIF